MTPYSKLKQAVRDGDNNTVLFLLAWLDGSLTSLDRQQGTNHAETVNNILGEAFRSLDGAVLRSLDTHPEAVA